MKHWTELIYNVSKDEFALKRSNIYDKFHSQVNRVQKRISCKSIKWLIIWIGFRTATDHCFNSDVSAHYFFYFWFIVWSLKCHKIVKNATIRISQKLKMTFKKEEQSNSSYLRSWKQSVFGILSWRAVNNLKQLIIYQNCCRLDFCRFINNLILSDLIGIY